MWVASGVFQQGGLNMSSSMLLHNNPLPDLRRLKVVETDEEIIISGEVKSYYMKQMAQEAVRPVAGVRRISNNVIVENRRPG
jgi:osmotically-inducible protein OsmY